MPSIQFFEQDITFQLPEPEQTRQWILDVILRENHQLKHLNYIFCSDDYLAEINQEYLNHDTYTDIVTFDNSDDESIEGDIFISIDRVRENARDLQTDFDKELHRVIIHGVLHLLGYRDETKAEEELMRKTEDAYLSLRNQNTPGD